MEKKTLSQKTIKEDDFLKIELRPPKKMKVSNASKETLRFWKELDSLIYSFTKKNKQKDFSNHYGRRGADKRQLCTVKMYYGNTKESHTEFLRRYMPQENKKEVEDKPTLFNNNFDIVPETEILKYESKMSELHFKIMISPENQTVPHKQLVRSFMKHLEETTGFHFNWMAVEHSNTGHKHCHILINGVDSKTKQKIRLPRVIIKETARNLAANICTSLIGLRTQEQINASKAKLPFAYRWTSIDENLCLSGFEQFELIKKIENNEYEAKKIAKNEIELKRLDFLSEIGLAKKINNNIPPIYLLEKNWRKKLQSIGRYNSFLEARNKLNYVNPVKLEQYTSQTGPVMGIITQRYVMDDEGVWKNAIVIENRKEDKAWFVPLFYKPDPILENATVSLMLVKNQKGLLVPKISILNTESRTKK